MKIISDHSFKNWAKNVRFKAPFFTQPETEQEIIDLIKQHQKIRVVGSGHSWSALCESEGLLMNLEKYNKVLELNKPAKTIKVQAGIKLHQLNILLDKEGMALSILGSIAKQTIAGAISTGTHGSGIRFQSLASQIIEFSLIKANGEKIILKKGDENFNAAISLGCLGVISEVTLQVTDAFNLHDKTYVAKFSEVINNIDEYLAHDHFKLWWFPPCDEVVIYTYKRTDVKRNDSRLRQILNDEILSVWAYRMLVKVGNLVNKWRNPINRFLTSQMKGPLDRIEKSFMVFNVPEPPKHRETEWAFDVKDAKELLTAYQQLFTGSHFTFNFIQEIRFTKGDDFWLSECFERDTLWIGAYNHEDKQWNEILNSFEVFAQKHNGRPHWGKEFTVRKNYLEKNYPKYAAFIELRKQFDPEGKFLNRLTSELFGI
ncbi:MAG: hypothetical protein JWN78_190 [Bacteroidota bacterium]|nr:hypothetical protein [Bacteroidota bacterium]